LHLIERMRDSWLYHAKTIRDHSTHAGGVPMVFHLGGDLNGQTWVRNPESSDVIEEDYPTLVRYWHTKAGGLIARLRAQAVAKMSSGMTAS
jgi:hypothetical protein